jgi:hypothetical protein
MKQNSKHGAVAMSSYLLTNFIHIGFPKFDEIIEDLTAIA